MRELGYLHTRSLQSLVEGCSQSMLIPHPFLPCKEGRAGSSNQGMSSGKEMQVLQSEARPGPLKQDRLIGCRLVTISNGLYYWFEQVEVSSRFLWLSDASGIWSIDILPPFQ